MVRQTEVWSMGLTLFFKATNVVMEIKSNVMTSSNYLAKAPPLNTSNAGI